MLVGLVVVVGGWLFVPAYVTRDEFKRVPPATSVKDVAPELAELVSAGLKLDNQNGHDPAGDLYTEYAYANWSRPASGETPQTYVTVIYDLHHAGRTFLTGKLRAGRSLTRARQQAKASGVDSVEVGALGDEHLEQLWPDAATEVVRVRNVLIMVTYNKADAPVEERQRLARAITAAAIKRLQEVSGLRGA